MTLLRLATGLARSSAPEHRWRRVAVPLSAGLFMVLLLAATSVVVMVERQNARNAHRLPEISSTVATTDLFMRLGHDHWRDQSIALAWIEPVKPDGKPVLAPGMDRFPRPGRAAVSPALARLIDVHHDLAGRYPRPLVLGEEGLRTGGELLAYVRPQAGRRIGGEPSAIRRQGGRWLGRGPVARVSGFGGRSGLLLGDPVSSSQVAQAVFGLLCLPALIVLMIGLAAASRLRDHRFQVLAALGAPARTTRTIAALESLVLSIPPLVGATVAWALVTPRVQTLPFLNYRLVRGDLAVPLWILIAEILVALALCAGGSMVAVEVRRRRATPRPAHDGSAVPRLALVPLAASMGAFLMASAVGGDAAARLNAVGIGLVIVGTPLVLPTLLKAVGPPVRWSKWVALSLAGSTMTWDPRRLARPFMGLGALVVVALIAIGYTSLMTHSAEGHASASRPSAVSVEWRDRRRGDVAHLSAELKAGLVVPFRGPSEEHAEVAGGPVAEEGHDPAAGAQQADVAVGATCPRLAGYVPAISCDRTHPYALAASARRRLGLLLETALDAPGAGIHLVSPAAVARSGTAFTLGDSTLRALDERTRSAAMRALPAPVVESAIDRETVQNPWVRWIGAGGTVAGAALAIACVLSLVDRLLAARQRHRHLLNLGISPLQSTVLAGALFAVPYGVMSAFAVAAGLVICVMLLDSGVPIPWPAIAATVLATLTVGAAGTGVVAALSSRQTLREAE